MNRFKNAQSLLLSFRRNVVFRAQNGLDYITDDLAATARFGVQNGRPEYFTRTTQNLILRNIRELNFAENQAKREILLSALSIIPARVII